MPTQHQDTQEFTFKIGELEIDGVFSYTYYTEYFPATFDSAPEVHTRNKSFDYPDDITYHLEEEEVTLVAANAYYDKYHSTNDYPDLKDWISSEIGAVLDGIV